MDGAVILGQTHGPDTIRYGIDMRFLHFTCALLLVLLARPAAQSPATPPDPAGYTIFLRGSPIGRENVSVRSDADGLTVVTEGRLSAPTDLTIRRAEFSYGP